MSWNINWLEQSILFQVIVSSNYNKELPLNILIGFSDHGFIAGSDFCMYNRKRNGSKLVRNKALYKINKSTNRFMIRLKLLSIHVKDNCQTVIC